MGAHLDYVLHISLQNRRAKKFTAVETVTVQTALLAVKKGLNKLSQKHPASLKLRTKSLQTSQPKARQRGHSKRKKVVLPTKRKKL